MLFHSLGFAVFILVVFTLHWGFLSSTSKRSNLLLLASYFFYMSWNVKLASLLLLSTIIDYRIALALHEAEASSRRRLLLAISVISNLTILSLFKYNNFFVQSFTDILSLVGFHFSIAQLDIVLPIGISFFTFQSLGYTIDVYYGRIPPTRSFRDFALFVAYFPQLIAGPILRARDFLPQLQRNRLFSEADIAGGIDLFLLGLLKKVFVADRLGTFVDPVFASPYAYDGVTVWAAVVAYALQIYCDFSGYSDMARGLGKIFGFDIMINFRTPYLSRNISEFWRRWHISLSSWFRDNLFNPLGSYRGTRWSGYRNLFITMFLVGLWHGASWTFAAWGLYHCLLLVFRRIFLGLFWIRYKRTGSSLEVWMEAFLSRALVFVLVCIGWVLFRAQTFGDAGVLFAKMGGFYAGGERSIPFFFPFMVLVVFLSDLTAYFLEKSKLEFAEIEKYVSPSAKAFAYAFSIILLLVFSPRGQNPFIYFQF